VEVANPLTPDESVLRRSLMPGMLRAIAFNADRRQDHLRLFEVGHVFPPPDGARVARAFAQRGDTVIDEREMMAVAFAGDGDDARTAARVWLVLADAAGIDGVDVVASSPDASGSGASGSGANGGLHPTRSARLVMHRSDGDGDRGPDNGHDTVVGVLGEVDPAVLVAFGLDGGGRRIGWLEIDLQLLLDEAHRRRQTVKSISRFPSSDVDLAFVVDDVIAAADVAMTLREAGGELLEELDLFDVYRGPGVAAGTRSLAYRLRFCALDRTLTDAEVGELRGGCIDAVERRHGASLRR
jgi:phenylalanyl-tRNA synthetase beta chain